MKKIITLFLLFLVFSNAFSQKEIWTYKVSYNYVNPDVPNGLGNDGMIVKAPLAGTNQQPQIVHTFDTSGILGKFPLGRLFQASNGKLYGITSSYYNQSAVQIFGVLFEYDPITSEYRVVANTLVNPKAGLIEPIQGMLYGITNNGSSVFKYTISTETFSIAATIPSFSYNSSNCYPSFTGELMKASDGFVYGITSQAPSIQNVPMPGGIYRLNLANNQLTKLYVFGHTDPNVDVIFPIIGSKLVEALPGKLYGTAAGGTHTGPDGVAPSGSGTLYEYTIATNIMVKKFDFDYNTIGANPTPLVSGGGNKIYGALSGHANNAYPNSLGSIYEYDAANSILTVLHAFDQNDEFQAYPRGIMVRGTDGNLYTSSLGDLFRYNPATNSVNSKIAAANHDTYEPIEICRKPGYEPFGVNAFTVCSGSPFTFDLHNTNATSYTWKKGTVPLPSQTAGALYFPVIATSDSGIYTCEMTNECGTTISPAITITVNPSNSQTITSSIPITDDHIMICPGSTVTLSGNNNGGTWSTGAITPGISVSEAGAYSIINTNACGNTYSNTVNVGVYETPAAINISYDNSQLLCLGGTVTFSGNVGGIWEDGSTGSTLTTTIDTTTAHFVTRTDECGTVTSNVIQFTLEDMYDIGVTPQISHEGLLSICEGGSIELISNRSAQDTSVWTWYKTSPFLSYVSNADMITVSEPGTYILERNSYCFGPATSTPVTVSVVTGAPEIPIITFNNTQPTNDIVICQGTSITLVSSGENNLWNTGETTSAISVSTPGAYNVISSNGCGSSTSNFVYTVMGTLPGNAITQIGNVLHSGESNVSYQWVDCGEFGANPTDIIGQNQQSFTASVPGRFAVRTTNGAGCENMSDCYTVLETDLGIDPNNTMNSAILLIPNPVSTILTLQTSLEIEQITVVNMVGQTILKLQNATAIDLSGFGAGPYIIHVETKSGIWRGKVVKN
jgi:hypothetical protein